MPNPAFFNLSEEKRNLIFSVAVEEFSSSNYDSASINQICKRSNIAKGSFYQYFTDKLDLYKYIMTLAIEAKITFFSEVLKEFSDFTLQEQIRLLFIKGIEFAKSYPKYAALGEQFSKEDSETARLAIFKEGGRQTETLFAHMIEHAKANGEINSNVDSIALIMLLQSLNRTVNDYMMNNIGENSFRHYDKDASKLVDSLLCIIFNGVKS